MVIADTGFWIALASAKDRHHGRAGEVLSTIREPLVTTWPVMTETCHLLLQRQGQDSQTRFLASHAAGAFDVFDLTKAHAARIVDLVEK